MSASEREADALSATRRETDTQTAHLDNFDQLSRIRIDHVDRARLFQMFLISRGHVELFHFGIAFSGSEKRATRRQRASRSERTPDSQASAGSHIPTDGQASLCFVGEDDEQGDGEGEDREFGGGHLWISEGNFLMWRLRVSSLLSFHPTSWNTT